MGGQISIIKKHEGKIIGVSAYTNAFSDVVYDKEFFTNPNNESFEKFIDNHTRNNSRSYFFKDKIELDQYGLYIVDYDTKSIYSINGYSAYINIHPSSLFLDEQGGQRSPTRDLFDRGDLCIRSVENILTKKGEHDYEDEYDHIVITKNVTEMDIDFKSMDDLIDWMEGDKFSKNPFKNREGNRFTKSKNGNTVFNEIFIDLDKLGWRYYSYGEDVCGYVELYNQLTKDGYKITPNEIKEWSDHLEEDEETGDTFLSLIKPIIRENTLNELGV